MPGVSPPSILDTVHSSCKAVLESQKLVTPVPEAITSFAADLDAAAVTEAAAKSGTMFPIKFDNQEAEVTFLALYHLLDFGSGYDALLRASPSGRGWRETVQYGCFGLALAAKRLDGPWMRAFSLYNLHTAFGIDSKVEEQLQPGITISKPGPLAPLVQSIHSAIVDTGKALEAAGVKSLGALILEHLDGLKAAGNPATAASLVQELIDTIPAFQDAAIFTPPPPPPAAAADGSNGGSNGSNGGCIDVVFARKAQALVADLGLRFGQEDARFAWTDAGRLAADSGPVLPAVLHNLGLLQYSDTLQQQLLPAGVEERALRAAAVAAVDVVVAAVAAAAGSSGDSAAAAVAAPFSAYDLGSYLLSQVKEEEGSGKLMFRGAVLTPHATCGTTAY